MSARSPSSSNNNNAEIEMNEISKVDSVIAQVRKDLEFSPNVERQASSTSATTGLNANRGGILQTVSSVSSFASFDDGHSADHTIHFDDEAELLANAQHAAPPADQTTANNTKDQRIIEDPLQDKNKRPITIAIVTVVCSLIVAMIIFPILYTVLTHRPAGAFDDLQPTVILISIDGFRWDYLDYTDAPNINRLLAKQGAVKAKSLIPSFPTLTFPNHYTIVTGLYPESHGIVANTMYDPVFNATFTLRTTSEVTNGRWWGGEPLWVTAEKQGQKSATFFWPGSEAEIKGVRPSYYERFNESVPNSNRVKTLLGWLDLPGNSTSSNNGTNGGQRPTFMTLYFEQVDHAGHDYGPNAHDKIAAAIKEVDESIGQLLDGLEERGIDERVNIIIVSDHGMTQRSPEHVVGFDQLVPSEDHMNTFSVLSYYTPVSHIYPLSQPGSVMITEAQTELHTQTINDVYDVLTNTSHEGITFYLKDEVPERLHFSNNRRIPPIVGVSSLGWTPIARYSAGSSASAGVGGSHGYDNQFKDMHAIFIAAGPAFKKVDGRDKEENDSDATPRYNEVESFENIHIYELCCKILGLKPAPNNGTLAAVGHLLVDNDDTE